MAEKRQPWMKFYPSDWRSEPRLRLVSRAARSLWLDMMGLMHEAEPYGHLIVGGQSLNAKSLASMFGDRENETKKLLKELENSGVFSRKDDGTIYSRRMERDRAKSNQDKENGGKGGNPRLKASDNGGVNPQDKAQKPEARGQRPEAAVIADAHKAGEASEQITRLNRVLGFDERDYTRHAENIRVLIELKTLGCDFDQHILPAAQAVGSGRGIRSLNYIREKAIGMRDAAKLVASMPVAFENTDERGWRDRLRVFRDKGGWIPKWGPTPAEPGCKCPAEILSEQVAA